MSARGAAPPLRGNFALVQALRGLAAGWVVLFHAAEGGHLPALRAALPRVVDLAVFESGHLGVPIFFGLSGFVIAHSLAGAAPGRGFFWRFVLRRSLRLDPAYWASMAVVVAFAALSAAVKHEAWAPPAPGQVAAHMFYLQELLRVPALNAVYWTLTFEVQFYLFFAAVLVLAHRLRVAEHAAWGLLYVVGVAAGLRLFDGLLPGLFLPLWPAFFAGALGYRAVTEPSARLPLLLLVLIAGARALSGTTPGNDVLILFATATALLLYAAARTGRIERGLDWRPLQWLGLVSYSLYLVHNPVTGAAGFVAHRVAGAGLASDLMALAAILAASLGAAFLLWYAVERPSHRWSRRVRLPRRDEAHGGGRTAAT